MEEKDYFLEEVKFYILNQKFAEAERVVDDFLKVYPDSAEAYYLKGLVCELQNRLDEAKTFYEKALALKPDYKEAQQHLDKIVEMF